MNKDWGNYQSYPAATNMKTFTVTANGNANNTKHIKNITVDSDEYDIVFTISGEFDNGMHNQFYIDSDNDKSTGDRDGDTKGADYLVENGYVLKYTNGAWDENNPVYIQTDKDSTAIVSTLAYSTLGINHSKRNIRVLAAVMDSDWSNYEPYPNDMKQFEVGVNIVNLPPTVYENAQDGTTSGWYTRGGTKHVINRKLDGNRVIYLPHQWTDENGNSNVPNNWEYDGHNYTNHALYELRNSDGSYWHNTTQKTLEVDFNPYHNWGNGASCFEFGVVVQTRKGERTMYMSTWYGRQNFDATINRYGDDIELVYPITKDLVYKSKWQHIKINLQEKLQLLEPTNRILRVDSFILSGGNNVVDNIKLSM
jgi:hypothetical protein